MNKTGNKIAPTVRDLQRQLHNFVKLKKKIEKNQWVTKSLVFKEL